VPGDTVDAGIHRLHLFCFNPRPARVPGDTRAVRVVGGIPDPLMVPLEELLEIGPLLLRKETIRRSLQGVAFVRDYRMDVVDFLEKRGHAKESIADDSNLASVHQLLEALSAELNKIEALQKIWGLQVDVLGAYFFRRPEVELYWLAIAIMASIAGVDVEPLTFVTLTHELAHAYTHLGRDIDGNQWETEDFSKSDDRIVEGLAQHYTQTVCQKLQLRYPAPLEVFNK